jgi:hypothetical protein
MVKDYDITSVNFRVVSLVAFPGGTHEVCDRWVC